MMNFKDYIWNPVFVIPHQNCQCHGKAKEDTCTMWLCLVIRGRSYAAKPTLHESYANLYMDDCERAN